MEELNLNKVISNHEYAYKLIPDISVFDYAEKAMALNKNGTALFKEYTVQSTDSIETNLFRGMYKSDKPITFTTGDAIYDQLLTVIELAAHKSSNSEYGTYMYAVFVDENSGDDNTIKIKSEYDDVYVLEVIF